jgi:hypothetical protein
MSSNADRLRPHLGETITVGVAGDTQFPRDGVLVDVLDDALVLELTEPREGIHPWQSQLDTTRLVVPLAHVTHWHPKPTTTTVRESVFADALEADFDGLIASRAHQLANQARRESRYNPDEDEYLYLAWNQLADEEAEQGRAAQD